LDEYVDAACCSYAPFAMAAFILLVACFNFMNNSMAVAGNRLKEIGVRKVIGGRKKELVMQFLQRRSSSASWRWAADLFSPNIFTEGWNGMWAGLDIAIIYKDNTSLFVALFVLIVVTSVLAGGYPAFYISKFRPIEILRGTLKFRGTTPPTKSLLVFNSASRLPQ